jgi:hypothetical protein
LFGHPRDADIREAVIVIATADRGMCTGEPDLFEIRFVVVRGKGPKRGREWGPSFIEGQSKVSSEGETGGVRMTCEFDIGVELDTVKLKGLCPLDDGIPKPWFVTEDVYLWNAEGTDGVPYTDEFDGDMGDSFVLCRQFLDGLGVESVVDVPSIYLAESLETGFRH